MRTSASARSLQDPADLLLRATKLTLRFTGFGLIPFLASRGRKAVILSATIGLTIMSFGCKYTPPHPPTFADFHRTGPGMLEDEKKLNSQVAVFEAARFLPQEIEHIRAKGDARELVGAALHADVGDQSIPGLLRDAWSRGSNDVVVLAGIAESLVRDVGNQVKVADVAPKLPQVLAELERLEPDNGLPLCLRAYVQLKQGDTNAACRSVKAAMQKAALNLHGSELRHCVLQTALALKYPRYTASMLAVGTLSLSTQIAIVGRGLLNNPELDRTTAEACLELGRRHEARAKLFIDQLIAFSLQKRALEFLKPPDFEQQLLRMKEAREKIKQAVTLLDSPKAHALPERVWLAYFDTLFDKSEAEAVEELTRNLNDKL